MRIGVVLIGFVGLIIAACVPTATAQVVATSVRPAQVMQPAVKTSSGAVVQQPAVPGAVTATPGTNAATAANAATKTPEQKKIDLLMAASFDRTTGGMLKAWSDKPEAKKTDDDKKDPPKIAKVENAFKGFVVLNFDKEQKLKVGQKIKLASTAEEGIEYGEAKVLSVEGKTISVKFEPGKKKASKAVKPNTAKPNNAKPSAVKPNAAKPGKTPDQPVETEQKAGESTDQNANNDQPKTETETAGDDQKESTEVKPAKVVVAGKSENAAKPAADEPKGTADDPDGTAKYLAIKNGDELKIVESKKAPENEDAKIQAEVDAFVRDVAVGNWDEVKSFLAALKEEDGDKVYGHLLTSLASPPKKAGAQPPRPGQVPVVPNLSPEDILALIDASPKPIEMPEPKKDDQQPSTATPPAASSSVARMAVELPSGISINQLPPDVQAKLAQQAGGAVTVPGAVAGSDAKPKAANHIPAIAGLIINSISNGHNFRDFYEKVKVGTTYFGGEDEKKRLAAADLFLRSRLNQYVEDFLPSLDEASTRTNLAALKLWSKYALLKKEKDEVADWLAKAWEINQDILVIKDLPKADKNLALENLIRLSSQVEKEIGVAWINSSFTEVPERGMTILTNLGTKSADMASKANQTAESTRLKLLRLQNEAVEKLIELSPDQAQAWTQALTLLAQNWLKEADISLKYSQETSRRGYMQIDMYGNYYWQNTNQFRQHNNRQPRPIKLGDILEIVPSDQWQKLVDSTLATNFRKTTANLYLRVNEEDKAFPFIEQIVATHPEIAKELVHEFLKIWTRNHDPNSSNRRQNPYIYFYGFDRKAEAIPLTRSKQERNLQELSGWVKRIREMEIGDVDEQLLANAFTTCHSSAEVFQIERFRAVFGDLELLKPETIAAICEKMRANLSSNWRDIRNQEANQTNRREPEVQQEVLKGYDMALTLTKEALEASPDNWRLHLSKATLMFDKNAYAQTVQKSSEFSDRRDAAFAQFAIAAEKYAGAVVSLEKSKQSTDVYDKWFYAGLGAVDLGKVTDKTVPDLKQYELVRNAIESLPGFLAESHMARFANNLFARMSPIKPEIKFRYLKGGFEIVAEHPRAWEARNLYDYYKDLVHEIKFSTVIDGDAVVGSKQPFGVYVNILHTKEIERESGGFGKYVQNQNNMMFAYNYGRPTENYRDKFTDSVDQALGEHFEVMNVTFQSPETMESRPAAQPGWRITPYAYLLLKPKGSEVDRMAPLKLDLDFLDTSGYVVIPVESPALVIDCSSQNPPMRPIKDLKVTQTLDERQADEGKLIVEISATGKGLVPDLEDIIDLKRENFELVSVDDQGVSPTAYEKDTDEIQIVSDRSWTVEYKAAESAPDVSTFAFSDAALEDTTVTFQRYEDADLVEAEQEVALERSYASFSWGFLYWLVPVLALGLMAMTALIYVASKPAEVAAERFSMPDDVNPFTVLSLLKDIQSRNGITREQGVELETSINRLEEYYFGDEKEETPDDLEAIAQTWLRRAK